jgi:asparagine synthase (glutamine-hydrolysing)
MCGIVGYTGRERPGLLGAMLATIAHRGPDGEGSLSEPGVHLAVCRLAIVDRPGGAQPRSGETGERWVVQNGEIYNHEALRARLAAAGHRFATSSDTEVLVHLLEERGPGALAELDGMFALAYWDRTARSLLLARDRLGEKPLYYAERDGELIFASEIKALLAIPGFERRVDPVALDEYLSLQYVTGQRTLFDGIRKLPPGHLLARRDGSMSVERWWAPPDPGPEALSATELRRLLEESVAMRLPGEVGAGCFLSGGVDSGAVAALMARAMRGTLRTFTVGFDAPGAADERADARALAGHLGAQHVELVVGAPPPARLMELAWHMDQPPANAAGIALFELARQAKETVTVILTGEGADELFGGYGKYVYPRVAAHVAPGVGRTLGAILARLPARGSGSPLSKLGRVLSIESGDERFASVNTVFDRDARLALRPAHAAKPGKDLVAEVCGPERPGSSILDRMMRFDLAGYLPEDNLMKIDRATMAHGLEARAPFLSTRIVDRALATAAESRAGWRASKKLLRDAVRPLVPARFLSHPKRAFDLPLGAWLAREWAPLVAATLSRDYLTAQRVFAPEAAARALAGATPRQVWTLLAFQLWYLRFIEDPARRDAILAPVLDPRAKGGPAWTAG